MKRFTLIFAFIIFSGAIFAQSNNTLMTVGDKKVSEEEFTYIYKKNNSDNLNEQSVDEYLELFKNFKLKVVEAEQLKMDTAVAFITELNGYRDQLAKPYLTENIKIEELVKDAYQRNEKEIKLDIIFIKLAKSAPPQDTVLAYEKAMKIRDRILSGEDFEKVATETSDDRLAANNKGHLAFIQSVRVPYAIQNFVFGSGEGKYSMPIKTDYGYYIVKLVEMRPAQGFRRVSHIMISSNDQLKEDEQTGNKEKIDSIYARILKGDKFEDLVKFSDDKGTAQKSGELPEFTTGRMVPEFEIAAFDLKKLGDISKPVKTTFGWHIIKLLEIKPAQSFEQQKDDIRKTIEKDSERKEIIRNYVTEKLKKEYKFKMQNQPEVLYTKLDSSIFKGKWTAPSKDEFSKVLFTVSGNKFSEYDLGVFIETKQKRITGADLNTIVDNMYKEFIYESLVSSEKKQLENKYPDFKYLMQEYHDGMLLFDLMKKEIWDKASEDSIGLKKFYNDNLETYNNRIDVDISIFKYDNENTYSEAEKLLNKSRKKYTDEKLTETINKSSEKLIMQESSEFSKGENIFADRIINRIEENKLGENQKVINFPKDQIFAYINNTKKSIPKSFTEIKGLIISDYQKYLEEKWINNLKNKYKITINQKALNNIKKSLK